jgi:hypothetical protein
MRQLDPLIVVDDPHTLGQAALQLLDPTLELFFLTARDTSSANCQTPIASSPRNTETGTTTCDRRRQLKTYCVPAAPSRCAGRWPS